MRNIELKLATSDDLDVRQFSIVEAMSASFHIQLVVLGREDVALDKLLGKQASLALHTPNGSSRRWTGVCAAMSQTSVEPDGRSIYTVVLAPELWMLTHRRNHRTFLHQSALQIASALLADWQIEPVLRLKEQHPKYELRVQYGESDYDFLRRVLADAGISFYFETGESGDTKLVLSDEPNTLPAQHDAIPFTKEANGVAVQGDHITLLNLSSAVTSSQASFADHDFRRPSYALRGSDRKHDKHGAHHALLEDYQYIPGHSHVESEGDGKTPVSDSKGVYRHSDKHSQARAKNHLDALHSQASLAVFHTTAFDLAPGSVFGVSGYPHPDLAGKKLLVVDSWIAGQTNAEWRAGGQATPAAQKYRPLLGKKTSRSTLFGGDGAPFEPLANSKGPRIHGVQSAKVVGPADEDVHTDEHGRVRVQFPWDREGKSSSWVRVSQAWAGAGFGHTSLPHVGQEVLLGFLDGSPDHPVVVGRTHNATSPHVYALPEHKTRTLWKGKSADGGGNEITFEDKKGSEIFYIQAEHDLHKVVGGDELEHTGGNRHITSDGDLIITARGKVIIHSTSDDVEMKGSPDVQLNPKKTKPAKSPPSKKPGKGESGHGYQISAKGKEQMEALMKAAQSYASGKPCLGRCLAKVEDYLGEVNYAGIGKSWANDGHRFPYAHDFADYLNKNREYEKLGLQRLPITNPYDAPVGSIIVVRHGTPGTANPIAGDIVVKGPGDHFYNDGEMGYRGSANFPPGNDYVLGIYAPK